MDSAGYFPTFMIPKIFGSERAILGLFSRFFMSVT
jgi:hypothetical protein